MPAGRSSGQPVIDMHRVGKRYRIGQRSTAREAIMRAVRRPFGDRDDSGEIWSLRDVSFAVSDGEALGIVGSNGAGKSTVLKILAGITAPTTGVARTRGRVAPLLEVGTGFHPELSGRENVFLNGAVLGMSRRDVGRRFDEIVAFSGVERFLDTAVKRYSSGMYLRLAFAVAAHLEPDILVVDEILAVGDAAFQSRCLNRMREAEREGRTVVFVSHDLSALARLCPRSLWLDGGRVRADGPTDGVIRDYLSAAGEPADRAATPARTHGPVELLAVRVRRQEDDRPGAADPEAPEVLLRTDPITVSLDLEVVDELPGMDLAVYLTDARGVRILDQTLGDDPALPRLRPGRQQLRWDLPAMLNVGEFTVGLWAGTAHDDFFDNPAVTRFTLHGSDIGRPDRVVTSRFPLRLQHRSSGRQPEERR